MRRFWIVLSILTATLCLVGLAFLYCIFNDPDDQGLKDFFGEAKVVEYDLRQFYGPRKDYPIYTLDQLQQMGAFDGDARSYWVHFTPFSSETPDSQIVLRLGYGPFGAIPQLCDISWTKAELTHDPDPDQSRWKDRLEDFKEAEVRTMAKQSPGTRIISAFASLDTNEPENLRGDLLIDYISAGESTTHRM